jgi:hypothetical protein
MVSACRLNLKTASPYKRSQLERPFGPQVKPDPQVAWDASVRVWVGLAIRPDDPQPGDQPWRTWFSYQAAKHLWPPFWSSACRGPTLAHDIYSHLTDETGASCCDDGDCRPAALPAVTAHPAHALA